MKDPEHPICQSCGMSIEKPFEFGTDKDGYHIVEYCRYCYKKGRLTEPDITLEKMVEKVAALHAKGNKLPLTQTKKTAAETLPLLARWRK